MGPATLFLADAYRSQVAFSEIARPFLERLNRETKETVHLFVFEHGEFFYLDKLESPYQVRMHSRVGVKGSLLHLSAGRALLPPFPARGQSYIRDEATPDVFNELEEIRKEDSLLMMSKMKKALLCGGCYIR